MSRRAAQPSFAGGWLSATLTAGGVAVLLPVATFLTAAWLLGWQLQSVQTGSMEPAYPVGSLLVVAQVDPATIEVGSPIVFRDPSDAARLVTHRVVAVAPGPELAFITKGDWNASADAIPVPANRVVGRPMWSVSHLGNLMEWIAWPRSILLIVVPAVLLVLDGHRRRDVAAASDGAASPRPRRNRAPQA